MAHLAALRMRAPRIRVMSRPLKLVDPDIQQRLAEIPHWTRAGDSIERTYTKSNFAAAVGFVNAIAVLAEKMDHHPDILVHNWNRIRVTLSTHDRGGLTELDFALAKLIDETN